MKRNTIVYMRDSYRKRESERDGLKAEMSVSQHVGERLFGVGGGWWVTGVTGSDWVGLKRVGSRCVDLSLANRQIT